MTGVIEHFGVLGVFLMMVPESACVPIPSEVTLLFSGFAIHQGWMNLPLAVLAATAGNLVGSLLAYAIGATHLLDRLKPTRVILGRWDALLERRGNRAILIARLLPLARTFVSLPAGARHVPLVPFITLTTIGCGLWALGLTLTGIIAAGAWATVDSIVGRAFLLLGLLTLAIALKRRSRPR